MAAILELLKIQAIGVIVGACLLYLFNKRLESHKLDIRKQEIIFSKYQEKRMESLAVISRLLGEALYETMSLLYSGSGKPEIPHDKEDSRETILDREFKARAKEIDASLLALRHAQESSYIFITDDLYDKLTRFRTSITDLTSPYCIKMMEPRHDSFFYAEVGKEARDRYQKLVIERHEIVKAVREYLDAGTQSKSQ